MRTTVLFSALARPLFSGLLYLLAILATGSMRSGPLTGTGQSVYASATWPSCRRTLRTSAFLPRAHVSSPGHCKRCLTPALLLGRFDSQLASLTSARALVREIEAFYFADLAVAQVGDAGGRLRIGLTLCCVAPSHPPSLTTPLLPSPLATPDGLAGGAPGTLPAQLRDFRLLPQPLPLHI